MKATFIAGLIIFAAVYCGMALNSSLIGFFILFFGYGLFMASTEGISRAWISNVSDKNDTGKALGVYAGFNSLLTLLASSLTGLIWYKVSPTVAFIVIAVGVVSVAIYFLVFIKSPVNTDNTN